jgi:molybdate-binding protein
MDNCKHFSRLFRMVSIIGNLGPSNSEIIEQYESSRMKLLNRMKGCGRRRLGQHCIRKYDLFNKTPKTEVINNSQPSLEDYMVH